jgi:uncharacterized protein (TIGR02231 family)
MTSRSPDQATDLRIIERLIPERLPDLVPLEAPVSAVTLLEDRARVVRRGRVKLAAGRNQLFLPSVAPVLQDVSLRAETQSPGARIADARVRRAMRLRSEDRPEEVRALEEEIRSLHEQRVRVAEDAGRHATRYDRAWEAMGRGLSEISADVGWGLAGSAGWREGFDAVSRRARDLRRAVLDGWQDLNRLSRDIGHKAERRRAFDRADAQIVAWAEIDVISDGDQEAEITIEYICPNALWRPMHRARLRSDGTLEVTCCAVVWQNTGEDWRDADLSFSTARASLGTEPPLLSDDLLTVQKKREEVLVATREVQIQKAGVDGGGGAGPPDVELPGVDDGGEVQNLRASGRRSVPSDGRPNVLPLHAFRAPAEITLVCKPEIDPKVIVQSTQRNEGSGPLLPGPVELARDSGFVGWTDIPYVAKGERFELGVGPDSALRVVRTLKSDRKVDAVDKWTRVSHRVSLHLSNISGLPKRVVLTERIPVSEIEHVRVELAKDQTTAGAAQEEKSGFVTWLVDIAGNDQKTVNLAYTVAYAPGVSPP